MKLGAFWWCVGSAWLSVAAVSWAEAPKVNALFPAGGQRGETVDVRLVGQTETASLKFWTSDPGIAIEPIKDPKDTVRFKVAPSTPKGGHWVRASNAEGASAPQLFVVGDFPEKREQEPNDSHVAAEAVMRLPVTVNGQLGKRGDVDAFAVTLNAGEVLEARVRAYQLDSPVDPLLRLTDEGGHVLAWRHDANDSLDPVLRYRAEDSGKYILMLSGFAYPPQARSSFQGSEDTVYRLTLSLAQEKEAPLASSPGSGGDALELPVRLGTTVGSDPAEARFRFDAVEGRRYVVKVSTEGLDSPLDGVLMIQDPQGKEVGTSDDANGADPALDWRAASEGLHTVIVRDLRGFGGAEYAFQLVLEEAEASVGGTVSAAAGAVAAGEILEIPLELERLHGHQRPVTVTLHGVPPGVAVQALTVPGSASEAALRLEMLPDVVPGTHRLQLRWHDGLREGSVMHPVKGATTEAGELLVNALDGYLLTLRPRKQGTEGD